MRSCIEIQLPPSKSLAIRALALEYIKAVEIGAQELSTSFNSNWPDDVQVMHRGAEGLLQQSDEIFLQEAGTPARVLLALAAATTRKRVLFHALNSLQKRPFDELFEALEAFGANITLSNTSYGWPVSIEPSSLQLRPVSLAMDRSSQFASALCLLSYALRQPLELRFTTPAVSTTYLRMTLDMLKEVGVEVHWNDSGLRLQHQKEIVREKVKDWPADWSSAVFFCAARIFLPTHQDLMIQGLEEPESQPDGAILSLLKPLGLVASVSSFGILLQLDEVNVQGKEFNFNLTDCPDLVPALVMAYALKGAHLTLSGVSHLVHKESNRLQLLQANLKALGGNLLVEHEKVMVKPCSNPLPASVSFVTGGDHRILMAMALVSLLNVQVNANEPHCVTKSFPYFHREWAKLCPLWLETLSE